MEKKPDYRGKSIVNLMSSILAHFNVKSQYSHLKLINQSEFDKSNNILLLIIDGLGYNYLKSNGKNSFLQNNLIGKMTSVFPSTTAAAITTFYSGLAPKNHGIPSWFTYLREIGVVSTILPFQRRGSTRNLIKDGVKPSEIFTFKSLLDGIRGGAYVILPKNLTNKPYGDWVLKTSSQIGYRNFKQFLRKIKRLLKKKKNSSNDKKLILGYLPLFDSFSHIYGIQSEKVLKYLKELDQKLEKFIKKIKSTHPLTKIIITADHGLIDTAKEEKEKIIFLNDHPILKSCLVLPVCGEPRAPFFYVRPSKIVIFENYMINHLEHAGKLVKKEELLKKNYFGLYSMHPELENRLGDYILLMKENYIFKDKILGEKGHYHIGNHGGLSEEELFVPYIEF